MCFWRVNMKKVVLIISAVLIFVAVGVGIYFFDIKEDTGPTMGEFLGSATETVVGDLAEGFVIAFLDNEELGGTVGDIAGDKLGGFVEDQVDGANGGYFMYNLMNNLFGKDITNWLGEYLTNIYIESYYGDSVTYDDIQSFLSSDLTEEEIYDIVSEIYTDLSEEEILELISEYYEDYAYTGYSSDSVDVYSEDESDTDEQSTDASESNSTSDSTSSESGSTSSYDISEDIDLDVDVNPTESPIVTPTPTPTPTSTPTPTVSSYEVYFGDISESSVLSSIGSYNYYARNALDGDVKTAWIEGVNGLGIGEWIEFSKTGSTQEVQQIVFYNGYGNNFEKNAYITKLQLTFSDGQTLIYDVGSKWQTITFDEPINTTYVRFTILEAGTTYTSPDDYYEDTAISEVEFYAFN